MNRVRLILHRLFRRPAAVGPYRLDLRRILTRALLDVDRYLVCAIAENPDPLSLRLADLEDRGNARAYKHDGWEPQELLVEKLTATLGHELLLCEDSVAALTDQPGAPALADSTAISWQREAGGA